MGALHAVVASKWLPFRVHTLICPIEEAMNTKLASWSMFSTTCLALCILGGHIRSLAYKHLGEDFTFALNRPSILVQSGVYTYIRHPSYTGLILVHVFHALLVSRTDAVVSCWRESEIISILGILIIICSWGGVVFITTWVLLVRVPEEEAFLQQTFGREWEGYCRQTWRLFPLIF